MTTRRPALFKESDVRRVLKAATAAGFNVTGFRIGPDGGIDVQFAGDRPGLTVLEDWKARKRHDAR